MSELVWENEASNEYDDEIDAYYVVKSTVPEGRPAFERRDKEEWYFIQSTGTRQNAVATAQGFALAHPGAPVRVYRILPQ